ncbi:hypothetical protein ACF0H5_009255 [Mactra antiquata]
MLYYCMSALKYRRNERNSLFTMFGITCRSFVFELVNPENFCCGYATLENTFSKLRWWTKNNEYPEQLYTHYHILLWYIAYLELSGRDRQDGNNQPTRMNNSPRASA